MGQKDAIDAHEALMNSKEHRDNILNEQVHSLGIGGIRPLLYTKFSRAMILLRNKILFFFYLI